MHPARNYNRSPPAYRCSSSWKETRGAAQVEARFHDGFARPLLFFQLPTLCVGAGPDRWTCTHLGNNKVVGMTGCVPPRRDAHEPFAGAFWPYGVIWGSTLVLGSGWMEAACVRGLGQHPPCVARRRAPHDPAALVGRRTTTQRRASPTHENDCVRSYFVPHGAKALPSAASDSMDGCPRVRWPLVC